MELLPLFTLSFVCLEISLWSHSQFFGSFFSFRNILSTCEMSSFAHYSKFLHLWAVEAEFVEKPGSTYLDSLRRRIPYAYLLRHYAYTHTSSSSYLSDIILRLRLLQQHTRCIIHVIHIAGTGMKAAGLDGLSRGDLLDGMMRSSTNPWQLVPLSQPANQRMPGRLLSWVNLW